MNVFNETAAESFENNFEVIEELLNSEILKGGKTTFLNSYQHKCPRCTEKSLVTSKFPYCLECNWDSLTDLTFN